MGDSEGDQVGASVGDPVGVAEGAADGAILVVGSAEGNIVGTTEGARVGITLGSSEGENDGGAEGARVSCIVGGNDGTTSSIEILLTPTALGGPGNDVVTVKDNKLLYMLIESAQFNNGAPPRPPVELASFTETIIKSVLRVIFT